MNEKYTFYRPNDQSTSGFDIEFVSPEKWRWGVVYQDGTELHQFDSEMKFHQFGEIVQSKVKMFTMYDSESENRYDIVVDDFMQIFHFYRQVIFAGGSPDERRAKVYCFGWKNRITGSNAYHFILPDGRMVMSSSESIDLSKFNI
jgi:hypothetical protein